MNEMVELLKKSRNALLGAQRIFQEYRRRCPEQFLGEPYGNMFQDIEETPKRIEKLLQRIGAYKEEQDS